MLKSIIAMLMMIIAFATVAHADCAGDPMNEVELQWGLLEMMPEYNPTELVDSIKVTVDNAQGLVHSYMIAMVVKESPTVGVAKARVADYCKREGY